MPEKHKHVFEYRIHEEYKTPESDYLACTVCNFAPEPKWLNAVANLLEALELHLEDVHISVFNAFDKVCEED